MLVKGCVQRPGSDLVGCHDVGSASTIRDVYYKGLTHA